MIIIDERMKKRRRGLTAEIRDNLVLLMSDFGAKERRSVQSTLGSEQASKGLSIHNAVGFAK
jgi:hypothetical protein